MRLKRDRQLCFDWTTPTSRKIVNEYRDRCKRISDLLDANPKILDLAHGDLRRLCEARPGTKSKRSTYTSENMLRAVIVHELEGTSFRRSCVWIAESETLRNFCRLGKRDVPDYTFLNKCFNAIRPATWQRINAALAQYATQQGRIDPSVIRTDTTVVEANIHYPTDASLLWDGFRVLARLLREARAMVPFLVPHRFHDRKVKKLYLFITRYASSPSKRRKRAVKKALRTLIGQVRRVAGIAEKYSASPALSVSIELKSIAVEIEGFVGTVWKVADVAERVHLRGEAVPGREKVYSIFEQHVELIKRGKKSKPVEFGHKVVLAETREKFITDYQVLRKQVADSALTDDVVGRHEKQFGSAPDVLAADGGFWSGRERIATLREKIGTVAIPKNVRDWATNILPVWQRFRAGVEGTISVLKRAFRLMRCLYRGFSNFVSAVGLGVFCHNLVSLADRGET